MQTMKAYTVIALGLIALVGNCYGADPKVTCTHEGQFIADIYDCKAYYLCNEALLPEHHTCPGDSYWDVYLQNCYPPPVQCAGDVTTHTPAPTTRPPGSHYTCTFPSEIVPYLYDCESYFICDPSLTLGTYYKCEPGYYYDPAYASCNLASRVTCIAGSRPLPFPTAIPSTGSVPPASVIASCHGPGVLVPDPVDCAAWWKCNQSNYPEKFFCAPDTKFDHYSPMRCINEIYARCF